jgi:hypothetical protein
MIKIIKGTLYSCDCGYETLSKDCASKHAKTKKCMHRTMNKKEMRFVSEEDYLASRNNTIVTGEHVVVDQTSDPFEASEL